MTVAPYCYDRREIGLHKPDPVLHASDCPDAPTDAHAVGYYPLRHERTTAALLRRVALRAHSCIEGGAA